MKQPIWFSWLILFVLVFAPLATPLGAVGPGPVNDASLPGAEAPNACAFPARSGDTPPAGAAAQIETAWQYGPPSGFQYQRFDGVFVPGPAGEPWANKVYFMGGRTSASTELPDIWVFDPITGVYVDTGTDMIEDVSNYNADLVIEAHCVHCCILQSLNVSVPIGSV